MNGLNLPHGGELNSLFLTGEALREEKDKSKHYFSLTLTKRQLCDIELILNGAFSPLEGFMGKADYENVLQNMRLTNGLLWSMPITLDVSEDFIEKFYESSSDTFNLALRDVEGVLIATMEVTDKWQPNKTNEAKCVFATLDKNHPGVNYLYNNSGNIYLGGKIKGIEPICHYDFIDYRHTPQQLRQIFNDKNWERVVAFQTRNPLHRAHVELSLRAIEEHQANLAIQAVVGMTKPGDVDHFTRVRCYQWIVKKYLNDNALLSLLPLAMRMGGPKEAIWHAIIRKNYGFSHFIVGRDHAGPGKDSSGKNFYDPCEAQDLVSSYQNELGINIVPFKEMVYVKNRNTYIPINEVAHNDEVQNISGTELRHHLHKGESIPTWFSYAEVIAELQKTYPPKKSQGATIFLTGLSGSGKSTIAHALITKLLEFGDKKVTLLDGDEVRQHLSKELGFSKEHRDLNIARIGFVAAEITKHGGLAICSQIAPFAAARAQVRKEVEKFGGFFEVYLNTPLSICEQRDRKGLYAKARAGLMTGFTGIDDAYEEPLQAEIKINTENKGVMEAVNEILSMLTERGYL